jgi:transcriptional regulator with XRE-family HTH domain
MSTTRNKSMRGLNKTTALSTYISKRLLQIDMTWADLMRATNMPKTNSTRIRRKGWIPSPDELNRLARAMGAPWEDLWEAAGHITREQIQAVRGHIHSYSYLWRLTPEEAQIIGAYRACLQDSRDFLLAAVRGVARASEHIFQEDKFREPRRTEIVMDFVNPPDYIYPLYGDTTMPWNKNEDMNMQMLPYAAQAAIVGILRYIGTGKMSPLPSSILGLSDEPTIGEEVEILYKDQTK